MAEWAQLRDYSRSRAVIMGTWEYAFLDPVPAVKNSLDRMISMLTGPLCSWPQERLLVLANEAKPGDLPDRLLTAFDGISDVALFYYAGHGQIAPDDQLCLGLVGSRPEANRRPATSLRFADVRQAMQDCDAATRIVILDCNFAGLALTGDLVGLHGDMADRSVGRGAYTMAATSAYATTWHENDPELDHPQTYFTKYLADLVERGIPGQPNGLRLDPLFRQLRADLAADQRLIPKSRAIDDASEFVFARNAAPPEPAQHVLSPADTGTQPDLLFRIYVPAGRLYAAEADRVLSLFRDWFSVTHRNGVRQSGYRTTAGSVYEFFAEPTAVRGNQNEDFNEFSRFLRLCSTDPSAAADALASTGIGRARSADLVAQFGREVRRLQVDLIHERERRILAIRHNLEEQLVASGVDMGQVPRTQIDALIEKLVPGPSVTDALGLAAAPHSLQATAAVTLNINQQFISATESTVIQNLQGTAHFSFRARELLELINRLGGNETPLLEAAVHELEDKNARPADRSAAGKRLKNFLGQIAGAVHDISIDLLEKYLESRIGM
jgi:hypothetical protein